jgi:hypothetical protein
MSKRKIEAVEATQDSAANRIATTAEVFGQEVYKFLDRLDDGAPLSEDSKAIIKGFEKVWSRLGLGNKAEFREYLTNDLEVLHDAVEKGNLDLLSFWVIHMRLDPNAFLVIPELGKFVPLEDILTDNPNMPEMIGLLKEQYHLYQEVNYAQESLKSSRSQISKILHQEGTIPALGTLTWQARVASFAATNRTERMQFLMEPYVQYVLQDNSAAVNYEGISDFWARWDTFTARLEAERANSSQSQEGSTSVHSIS